MLLEKRVPRFRIRASQLSTLNDQPDNLLAINRAGVALNLTKC